MFPFSYKKCMIIWIVIIFFMFSVHRELLELVMIVLFDSFYIANN